MKGINDGNNFSKEFLMQIIDNIIDSPLIKINKLIKKDNDKLN